tara:strand:+ start:232 stop:591 length:360 start_codon:yes stop_codon:yes gene_type:complete
MTNGVIFDTKQTEMLLQQWGRWSRISLKLNIGRGDYTNVALISDDMALVMDKIIAEMGSSHPVLKQILLIYYRDDYNFPMVANAIKCGETRARALHTAAVAWVDGSIKTLTADNFSISA